MAAVEFLALMKKLEIRSLVSGDKTGRLTLDFNLYSDDLIADLNGLMKADQEVRVTIGEGDNTE